MLTAYRKYLSRDNVATDDCPVMYGYYDLEDLNIVILTNRLYRTDAIRPHGL